MAPVAPYPTSPTPARRRRWYALATALWAVIVVATAYVSTGRDEPTVREQSSVAQARATVDRAVNGVVAAAGPDAVVSVSPFTRLGTCRISPVRDGEEWEQVVVLRTRDGGEGPLLDRLAAGLPPEYGARARHGDGGRHTLRADAGDFVAVSGEVAAPGEIRVSVTTGCRPR